MFVNPVAFYIGSWPVRWYGISYSIGVFFAWRYCRLLASKFFGLTRENIDQSITWGILGIIIGGRLGHVFFYYPDYYLRNPEKIIKVWEGGMAFHGGIIAVFIAFFLYCRYHKISFLAFSDCWSCCAPIGLFFGRIANFINQELYGKITKVSWGVVFPYIDSNSRHPSQLYEALLEGLLLFVFLNIAAWFFGAAQKKGLLTGLFFCGYSITRWVSEYFREATDVSIYFPELTLGQLYCVPLMVVGIIFIVMSLLKNNRNTCHLSMKL
jgi:phosphatidylglycerol---prolipoprotein diacylglyceryl transferase